MARQGILRGCRIDDADWKRSQTIAEKFVPPTNRLDVIRLALKIGLNEFEKKQKS